eukprot:3785289-Prymnesium_polylepis.1
MEGSLLGAQGSLLDANGALFSWFGMGRMGQTFRLCVGWGRHSDYGSDGADIQTMGRMGQFEELS